MSKIEFFLNPNIGANNDRLLLDYQNSIILPTFDTALILKNKSIKKIVVALFLLETNTTDIANITINPFDLNTLTIDDGLSSYITPRLKNYIEFDLPRDLFEELVNSTKRLLIRSVDEDAKFIFSGPDTKGTNSDPILTVTYTNDVNNNFKNANSFIKDSKFENIRNLQIHFELRNDSVNTESEKTNWTKWATITGIIVGIGGIIATIISSN